MHIRTFVFSILLIPVFFTLHSSNPQPEDTGIRGSVGPVDAVQSVLVFAPGKDTLRATYTNGLFSASVKPGVYQLVIDAAPGYNDMQLERIAVEEGRMTDVGALIMQKILP